METRPGILFVTNSYINIAPASNLLNTCLPTGTPSHPMTLWSLLLGKTRLCHPELPHYRVPTDYSKSRRRFLLGYGYDTLA